jgi:spermidine/putrescine transport system ATP-binding protein
MKGSDTPTGGVLELAGLRKVHGTTVAVDRIDMRIVAGEFFSLLGPSGCGKTTTLQMIGGFEAPSEGSIRLDGRDLTGMPAHRRPINTVFQSYALFPHLSVAQNVEYGLRWRPGVSKAERRTRAGEALDLVQLSRLAGRRPTQLSGGEQQRVALARALVCRPSVLLLDEPFGALDAKLRKTLRAELAAVQRAVGTTFVFVTHDQEEALEISDRIAVMNHGRVVQCGRPKDVYETPDTEFVADFLGLANLLEVTCVEADDTNVAQVRLGEFPVSATPVGDARTGPGRIVVRPERIRLEAAGHTGANRVPAIVDRLVYVGATSQVLVRLAHGPAVQVLLVNDSDHDHLNPGQPVTLFLPPTAVRLLAPEPAPASVQDPRDPVRTAALTTD